MTDLHDQLQAYGAWVDDGFVPFDPASLRDRDGPLLLDAAPEPAYAPASDAHRTSRGRVGALVAVAAAIVLVVALVVLRPPEHEVQVGEAPSGWAPTASFALPEGRRIMPNDPAIWTGHEVLLPFALVDLQELGTATRESLAYDPARDAWRALPAPPAGLYPSPDSATVWTGRELWVLSHDAAPNPNQPGPLEVLLLDPATSTWRRSSVAVPSGLQGVTGLVARWTGREVVVVADDGQLATYDPTADAWRELPTIAVFPDDLAACPSCESLEVDATWSDGGLFVVRRIGPTARPTVPDEALERTDALLVDPTAGAVRRLADPLEGGISALHGVGADVVATIDAGNEIRTKVWHAATDTWTEGDPVPHARSPWGLTVDAPGAILRVDAGMSSPVPPGTGPGLTQTHSPTRVARLDVATGRWTEQTPSAAQPAWWLGGLWAGDRLVTWGGGTPFRADIRTILGATWTPS